MRTLERHHDLRHHVLGFVMRVGTMRAAMWGAMAMEKRMQDVQAH